MDFDFKIIFWVLAIGFYIYTQLKDTINKGNKTDPIPMPPSIPTIRREEQKRREAEPVTTLPSDPYNRPSYKSSANPKNSKRFQSEYTKADAKKRRDGAYHDNAREVVSREAFYKESAKPVPSAEPEVLSTTESVFGKDEHLDPYTINRKKKHPLMTFLSDKTNLKNAFITGEVLRRRD